MSSNAFLGNAKSDALTASNSTGANPGVSNVSSDTTSTKKQGLKCSYCHKDGHTKETCYKLVGYPPRGRGKGKFTGNQGGFRTHPVQMQSQQANNAQQVAVGTNASPQFCLEQFQQQMAQLSHMVSNLTSSSSSVASATPEDHVSSIAGLAFSMMSYIPAELKNVWIIDSGASSHMCCNINLMTNITLLHTLIHVALPNSQSLVVHKMGSV